MEGVYFVVRYIPWWASPMLTMCAYFSYVYMLKRMRYLSLFFAVLALVSTASLAYYVYAGNPERAVELFREYLLFN